MDQYEQDIKEKIVAAFSGLDHCTVLRDCERDHVRCSADSPHYKFSVVADFVPIYRKWRIALNLMKVAIVPEQTFNLFIDAVYPFNELKFDEAMVDVCGRPPVRTALAEFGIQMKLVLKCPSCGNTSGPFLFIEDSPVIYNVEVANEVAALTVMTPPIHIVVADGKNPRLRCQFDQNPEEYGDLCGYEFSIPHTFSLHYFSKPLNCKTSRPPSVTIK